MASYPGLEIISLERLRASLSLLLPVSDAVAATEHLDSDPDISSEEFRHAIRSVQLRLLRQRIGRYTLWFKRNDHASDDPTARIRDETSDAGLALVLHLGLGIQASQLVHILGSYPYQVSRDLLDVRLRLVGRGAHTCKVFLDTLGRYRDGYVDPGLAATLSGHRVRCPACHSLLREFEQVDNRLIAEIQSAELSGQFGALRPRGTTQRIVAAAPAVVIATALVVTIAVAAGFADSLIGGNQTPLYAASDTTNTGRSGWIMLGSWDGGIHAFDPETGRRQVLHSERNGGLLRNGANFLVSPNGDKIAIFEQSNFPGLHWSTGQLDIVSVTGEPLHQVALPQTVEGGWPTGWLNEDEILLVSIPSYNAAESAERYLQRLEDSGRLWVVNASTGEQREIYQGAVAQVVPSPDGSRIAMVRPRDPREPATTVDVWEVVDGELGDLIATVEHRFTWQGGLLWSPTSDALYLGYVGEFTEQSGDDSAPSRDGEFRGQYTAIDLLRIDRDGSTSLVVDSGENEGVRLIGISNDSSEIVYQTFAIGELTESHLHRLSTESGEHDQLERPEHIDSVDLHPWRPQSGVLGYGAGYLPSPNGRGYMIMLAGNHYLSSDDALHQEPHQAFYLTLYDEDREPSVVAVLSSRRQVYPLQWVPDERLADAIPTGGSRPDQVGSPEPIEGARSYVLLDEYSALSPDGSALIMSEAVRNTGRPFLWYPESSSGRWIAQRTEELGWYSDGHAVLGVTEVRRNGVAVSRITQHSAGQRGGSSVDAFFDPAGIDDSETRRYALPTASTDAIRTGFYVIDSERGRADLWISDLDHGARSVHGMRYSTRIGRLSPLTGTWLNERSFLFTQALEYADGFPRQTGLMRLTIDENGEAVVEQLLAIEARGRDRGVAIQEFAIDVDGQYIAYRLRHFTDEEDSREGYDTIHLATTDDVTEALEIQRGDLSTGLRWSPSGHALALAIDSRIGIYFVDEHRFEFATSSGRPASHPAWISDSDLWFNLGSGGSAEVRRVELH